MSKRTRQTPSRSPAKRSATQPSPSIAERLRRLRHTIQAKGLGGYLVTDRPNQFYLTGFDGEDGAVLILPRKVYLLTDGRFAEEASQAAGWAEAIIRKGKLSEALKKLTTKHRLEKIGLDPATITVEQHASLRKEIKPTRLVSVPDLVARQRLYKDETEVAAIEHAVRVAEGAFERVTKKLKPGVTERELAAELQHEMIRRGATEASFPIIVAEGPNSSLPHAKPGDRTIRVGSAVLIDWGATVEHYRSDLTRVIFIRRIPPRFRRMYEAVLAAQAAALAAIRPGERMCDVDAAARNRLKKDKLDQAFSHGLGHGIGLDIHEPPRVSFRSEEKLEPGMVITVEPGVYLPGVGGVRIEDDVLVTERGCRILSRVPKSLDEMIV